MYFVDLSRGHGLALHSFGWLLRGSLEAHIGAKALEKHQNAVPDHVSEGEGR